MKNIEEIKTNIRESLTGISPDDYGAEFNAHLFEQYKLFLASADKVSDRRQLSNTFFLTLNTGMIAAIGFSGYFDKNKSGLNKDFICFLTAGIVIFCYVWYRLIRSYKDLNSAKFKVIDEIEKKLPLRLFYSEWEGLDRGRNPKIYLPFAKVETFIPVIFLVLYILMLLYVLIFKP